MRFDEEQRKQRRDRSERNHKEQPNNRMSWIVSPSGRPRLCGCWANKRRQYDWVLWT